MNLEAHELTKSFGDKRVLKGVSLTASAGKAFGLLGRNGAGKTTAIRIIMGIFAPDSGEVLLGGKPFERRNVSIGYMPEERGLYQNNEIMEQLVYLAKLRGMNAKAAEIAAQSWLDRFEIGEYSRKKLSTLSKGNQQKVQLASTLMTDPDIVILDEPFSGLDPVNAILLQDAVRDTIKKGKIVFFSSHQMNYVEEFCDRIAILNNGKIVIEDSIEQVKRKKARNKIEIRTASGQAMLEYVKAKYPHSAAHEGSIIVTLGSESDKAQCFAYVSNGGIDYDSMSVVEPTLSDIFVEYTMEAGNE